MSSLMHRLIHSARVYAQTALEVAVLGAGDDLMRREPAVPQPAATAVRHASETDPSAKAA